MTLPGWTAFHRGDDDELLGYRVADEHGTTPLTVFGFVSHDSERRELRAPTGDRLRPFRG